MGESGLSTNQEVGSSIPFHQSPCAEVLLGKARIPKKRLNGWRLEKYNINKVHIYKDGWQDSSLIDYIKVLEEYCKLEKWSFWGSARIWIQDQWLELTKIYVFSCNPVLSHFIPFIFDLHAWNSQCFNTINSEVHCTAPSSSSSCR